MNCVICTVDREPVYGLICKAHFERLAKMLREIEAETCLLDARPSMAIRTGSGKGSLASERAPARLEVLAMLDPRTYPYAKPPAGPSCVHCWHDSCIALRAWDNAVNARATDTMSVLDTLHGWARVVREDRDHATPDRVTVASERNCLTRNLEWLAEQGFIDELYVDSRKLLGQLRSANQTAEIRPKMVGICPTLLDDGECGGGLWPDENRGEVVCDKCDRIFGFEELRHLGEMLVRQGYVEVFRASWVTGVPVGTIRRWVSEGKITSEKDGKKLTVQVSEVETLHQRRKGARAAS